MRLGYFGGTFDPPHLGHLAVAQAAADAFSLDQVLLVPTAIQPLKPVTPLAPYADRLAMVSLLCAYAGVRFNDPRLQASDLEAPRTPPSPNYTVDTLQRLQSAQPEVEIFVIVGVDAFQAIPHWRSPDILLSIADWIVVSRPSSGPMPLPTLTPAQASRVHSLQTVDNPASATAIRAALASRNQASIAVLATMLPPEIRAYIQQHHLYV